MQLLPVECGCPSLTHERDTQDLRRDLLVHPPHERFHGEIFRARRCDRRVSIPGDEDVALLRPVKLTLVVCQAELCLLFVICTSTSGYAMLSGKYQSASRVSGQKGGLPRYWAALTGH